MDGQVIQAQVGFNDDQVLDMAVLLIDGYGDFDLDVVGESAYQDALWQVFGEPASGDDRKEVEARAFLILDSDNKHDPDAVRVHIDGMVVGYLAKHDAKAYRTALRRTSLEHGEPVILAACDALIVGGFIRRTGERASLGVKLDIELPMDDESSED